MTSPRVEENFRELCRVVAALQSGEEAASFFRDIATPAEIKALSERWRIACLLDAGALSYREIAAETGASTTTVARVARFLKEENHHGYRLMLDRQAAGRSADEEVSHE
ncbi:MAG: YerC/YecD family TrpR-related protein [Pseudomonadota bacterium]